MLPIFKYDNITETNSKSESLFKDFKNIVFKHKKFPVRINEFLKIHATSIFGTNNIIRSNYEQNKILKIYYYQTHYTILKVCRKLKIGWDWE